MVISVRDCRRTVCRRAGVVRRGDGAFHQRHVIRPAHNAPRGFREVGDLDRTGDSEQFILAVQQR